MFKKISMALFICVAASFAEDEVYIRNICDSLPSSSTPKVKLQLTELIETTWYGSKDLSKKDSGKVTVHKDYNTVVPFLDQFKDKLPISIPAACNETKNNLYEYGEWSASTKKWTVNDENDDYATLIMDVNMVELAGYDASNSYNILAMRKGSLPEDYSYSTSELMVSRTFEFRFDWWYSIASYFVTTVETNGDTQTTRLSYHYGKSVGLDSASAVANSVKSLNVPDSVSKVQFQLFHGVLEDANKVSSSSSVSSSSVSSEPSSSASTSSSTAYDCGLSCDYQPMQSSSSEETTSLVELRKSLLEMEGAREIRRLDGTRVRNSETLVPGVYYVKGLDGRWKKQVELPR